MSNSATTVHHTYSFNDFSIDLDRGCLLRGEHEVKVRPKVFEALRYLVENNNRLVSKAELIGAVWPDSFVTDDSLVQCLVELRRALADDPQQVIKTVPRRGYIFAAEVREIKAATHDTVYAEQIDIVKVVIEETNTGHSVLPDLNLVESVAPETVAVARPASSAEALKSEFNRPKRRMLLALAIVVVAVAGIAFTLYKFVGPAQPGPAFPASKIVPFTSFPGRELHPAFSPDGKQIAFAWNGEKRDNLDIYIKLNDTETPPLRLTSNAAADVYPAWSPDGRLIAFVRQSGTEIGIFAVPALGGPERKLHSGTSAFVSLSDMSNGNAMDWSPDGKFIAFSGRDSLDEPNSIFLLSVESLELRRLTSAPAGFLGDSTPAFSPDGQTLAFIRWAGGGAPANGIYLVPTSGGEPKRLTFNNSALSDAVYGRGLAWTADGGKIVFSSASTGSSPRLWSVSASGGTPEPLAVGGEGASTLAISRQGDRLAYSQEFADTNIWRIEVRDSNGKSGPPTRLISSTRLDFGPQFSPDGKRIAFASGRSGSVEILISDSDGLDPIQLTTFGGPDVGSPRWSPDGRRIAFDSPAAGSRDIYLVNVDGGKPRRLTDETSYDVRPSWSRDGAWIYFGSNRGGNWQVWKAPAEGGKAVQVTQQGGREAFESFDGKFVYYSRGFGIPGIWRVSVTGGEEVRILDGAVQGFWALLEQGIYFVNPKTRPRPMIEFFNFSTGRTTQIAAVEKELQVTYPSLAVSPDGRSVLYVQLDSLESDIILVENFR